MNEYEIFKHFLSAPRIERYLFARDFDEELCVKLYKSNLNISKSFHPVLGIFEVVLRNEIDKVLQLYFNDDNWIINQQYGFMIAPALSYFDPYFGKITHNRFIFNSVEMSKIKILKKSTNINSNRVLAEQSLSFWTELFEKKYYKLLKGRPIQIFKNLPKNISRVDILNQLTKIRKFRNRIYHNEPICFKGNEVDLQTPLNIYISILNLMNWINPDTHTLLKGVDEVYDSIYKIY
jgi:hypothetical protein